MGKYGLKVCCAALLAVCLAAGCGKTAETVSRSTNVEQPGIYGLQAGTGMEDGGEMEKAAADTAEATEESAAVKVLAEGAQNGAAAEGRKLIKEVSMDVETQDFDGFAAQVTDRVEELGGYIESSGMNNYGSGLRSADMCIRIPKEALEAFTAQIGNMANVLSKSVQVQDVTLAYVDMDSHKRALQTEQERLLELMAKAETVEDIIAIEGRLSDVRYQIESMEAQLRVMDNQVDYSTVWLSVLEVERLSLTDSPRENVWNTVGAGFSENVYRVGVFFKELGIGFLINLPFILVWAAAFAVGILAVRLALRRRAGKREGLKAPKRKRGKEPEETAEIIETDKKEAENGKQF